MEKVENQLPKAEKKRSLLNRLLRLTGFVLLLIVLLSFMLSFIIQIEWVQNRLVHAATEHFSEKLQTEVSIDRIRLDFFDQFVLEDFFAADFHGDTLLYSQELNINLNTRLLTLLQKKVAVSDLTLSNARLYMRRYPNEHKDDFTQLVDKLGGNAPEEPASKSQKPWFLEVKDVYLCDVEFIKDDSVGGEQLKVYLQNGAFLLDTLDIAEKKVVVNYAGLYLPEVSLVNFPGKPFSVEPADSSEVIPPPAGLEAPEADSIPPKKWSFQIGSFNLEDGIFVHHNYRSAPVRTLPDDQIDYNHLSVSDIQLQLSDFSIRGWTFSGAADLFSLRESSGFVLDNLSASSLLVSPQAVELLGLSLVTPHSSLSDTLRMKFRSFSDFKDFPNKVRLNGQFDRAYVGIQDIMAFAPALRNNTFFSKNKNETVYIDGILKGKINNLDGRDLDLWLGRSFRLLGNFYSRNLTDSDETLLNLKLKRLSTDITTLRQLVPGFNPPANFDKLGQLVFSGNFFGFFNDFVADGFLETDLGNAAMDMQLNGKEGRAQAEYHGQLELRNFDLAGWTGNTDFGQITLSSRVYDGVGLTSQTAAAKLEASIDAFDFKGYQYKNLVFNGTLNQNLLEGALGIEDPNIDFNFDGTINFETETPRFDFEAAINKIDFQQLNLHQDDLVLSGGVDLKLRAKQWSDLRGFATVNNLKLVKNKTEVYQLDSLQFIAANSNPNRERSWRINSEVFDAQIKGKFEAAQIIQSVLKYVENNFPAYAKRFNIQSKIDSLLPEQRFACTLEIKDTKNLTRLLTPKLDTLKNIQLSGYFDAQQDSLNVKLVAPEVGFDNVLAQDALVVVNGGFQNSKLDVTVHKTRVGKWEFTYTELFAKLSNNNLDFRLTTRDTAATINQFNLDGTMKLVQDQFNISLSPTRLVLLNTPWQMEEDNFIQIGKNFLRTQNFRLFNDDQQISLTSQLDKGLTLEVEGFDMGYIDSLWDYSNLDFAGRYTLGLEVEDIFERKSITLDLVADTFFINQDNYGTLSLHASTPDLQSPLQIELGTQNQSQFMQLTGYYNLPGMTGDSSQMNTLPGYLATKVEIKEYPLHLAEYWVVNGVTNTVGKIDAQIALSGFLSDPDLNGEIRVYEGATTIDYINTRYYVKDETIKMNNQFMLDASNGKIFDEDGNSATLYGGITHDFFKNLALDCRVVSSKFTILNTEKIHNEVFYGKGVGNGEIYFSGDFNRTNIDIKATTEQNTDISIPVYSSSEVAEASFIRFEPPKNEEEEPQEDTEENELRGVQLHMELELTNDAKVALIFDETTGEIMQGTGYGNVKMDLSRTGDVTMFGGYEIESGNYLFNFMNLVAKPFTIESGGIINWSGDPYNALINIRAQYAGLSTSPYNFIIEYLNEDEIRTEASQPTAVNLTMILNGQLLKPDVNFQLRFPNLNGELKNYTDNKIRSIEHDQNALNTQVLGLIVFGNFLPSNQGTLLAGRESQLAINTLTELLSTQLSMYLTEILAQGLSDISFLDLEGFNVDYSQYDGTGIENPEDLVRGHEVSINPRFRFRERWVLNIAGKANMGGTYAVNNNADALVTGDFILEYELTKDRQLKIRGYYKNEPDIFGGRRNNAGVGLSFRKEFNDFSELFSFIKKRREKSK